QSEIVRGSHMKAFRIALVLACALGAPAAAQPVPVPALCAIPSPLPPLTPLFLGVGSVTLTLTCPNVGAVTAYLMQVDLTTSGLSFETSTQGSGGPGSFDLELTTSFLLRPRSQVAFNANLFTVCCTDIPPTKPTQLRGLEVSHGKVLSPFLNDPFPPQGFPFDTSLIVTPSGL